MGGPLCALSVLRAKRPVDRSMDAVPGVAPDPQCECLWAFTAQGRSLGPRSLRKRGWWARVTPARGCRCLRRTRPPSVRFVLIDDWSATSSEVLLVRRACMPSEQVARILNFILAEPAPPIRLSVRFTGADAGAVVDRVRAVMMQVAAAQSGSWPDDEQWRRSLPGWFKRSFEGCTDEELFADPNRWDFGSWLDAMKHPGWEWWSSGLSESTYVIECTAFALPFALDPLLYLVRAAGAEEVSVASLD